MREEVESYDNEYELYREIKRKYGNEQIMILIDGFD